MEFLSLNDTAKAYMIMLCILSFLVLLITVIAHITQKSKFQHVAVHIFLLIVSVFNYSMLLQLNKIGKEKYDFSLTPTSALFNSIPCVVYILLNFALIIFALFSLYSLYKRNKDKISTFSVKQALENLPTGIAFITDDTELLLSNHIMHELCKELTGKALQSARTFWVDLNSLQDREVCVIKGKEPAFLLSDGKVWQFSKHLCRYNDDDYYEFKATDITELYNLSEDTRKVNEKLIEQRQRLKKLEHIIEENAESGVALNMKINFHDNFGNLLTLTKKTLREDDNTDETRALVDYWGDLNNVIKKLSSDEKQSLTLDQIMLFAQSLGCEIILEGDIPTDEHNKTTTLLCVNEMLKNAYRHAGAKMLTVRIFNTEDEIDFTIQNDTEHRLTEIVEGGGLSGLRRRIEQTGGVMKMHCDEGVSMSVKLPKGGQ